MDLELKDEWKDAPLRGECWTMSTQDCAEIEAQVDELVQAGLVEPFPPGTFPKYCSPTFLVDKKESKTRRMVGQYVKLNRRTKPNAAFLPNMESLIESMAKCKYKTKLDLRSGFWQVGLTERAKELSAFTTPSGRCFRWLCMPFGLQGAPGVFQEMIELLCSKVKANPKLKPILTNGHLGAFFDDCGIGTQTIEEHVILLEAFLSECQRNHIRVKLSKCEFMKEEFEYLGYTLGYGTWSPSKKKVEAILKAKVTNLKELQSFLGAMNFFRRHVPNFSQTSHVLTDLLKKETPWTWGKEQQTKMDELKAKLAKLTCLGTPKPTGEMVVLTDSSDVQGGATIFQWQSVPNEVLERLGKTPIPPYETKGIKPDGTFDHTYPSTYTLVPLGYYSWKWNTTRQRYHTYERELLAGVLTLGTQYRMLAHLPIVWFCDNQATKSFLDSPPPTNPRLRRWYTFLSQFQIAIKHIPGLKNEMCDWLSRGKFETLTGTDFDKIASDAFQRMDTQIDFSMLFKITKFNFNACDYVQSEFKEIWEQLEERKSTLVEDKLMYRTDKELFCETKKVVPQTHIEKILRWCHEINGHPGAERTTMFFSRNFYSELQKGKLTDLCKLITDQCEVCLKSKPNTSSDRGLISTLPITQLANDTLYIDFISMDDHNQFNYVLTIVDGLTRFVKFIPCQ